MAFSFHNLIMNATKAQNEAEHNNVSGNHSAEKHNNTPPVALRLSTNYAITMSDALLKQLDRYCVETRKPRSKVIRNAVYMVLENPAKVLNMPRPRAVPEVTLPPERPNQISWAMPQRKPKDIEHFHKLCPTRGSQFPLVRRAVYLYTVMHKSPDKDEHLEAMKDGWV